MKKNYILFTTIFLLFSYFLFSSSSSGISGQTTSGCTCHGSSSSNTSITVSTTPATTMYANGQTYNFTIKIANATKASAGFDLKVNIGSITAVGSGINLVTSKEITHNAPKALVAGSTTWTFSWKAPTSGSTALQINVAGNAVNGDGGTNGDQWNFGSINSIPLPLVFTDFQLINKENAVEINWQTTNENNVKNFIVEHSLDGNTFSPIATIMAKNKIENSYTFEDKSTNTNATNYYRIKEIDLDGNEKISNTKSIYFPANTLKINTNNIVNHTIQIENMDANKNYTVQVINTNGQIVFNEKTNTNTIQLPNNCNGFYFLKITNERSEIELVQKIIVY